MFKELAKLTEHSQLKIVVTGVADNKLNLIITTTPMKGDAKSPFSSPLSLTATPEELDAELPAYLSQYTESTTSLFAQFQEQLATVEAEAKEATEKAKSPVAKKAASTPTAKTETKTAVTASIAKKAEEQQIDMLALF